MHNAAKFIEHDFKLPVHDNELSKANEIIEKIKDKIKVMEYENSITDNLHVNTFEEVIKILDYVGNLSVPAFEIEEELEEMYKMHYLYAPELCKMLWLEHYENIHHPYNLLKNRCYRLLDELDEMYMKKFKKYPINWKI